MAERVLLFTRVKKAGEESPARPFPRGLQNSNDQKYCSGFPNESEKQLEMKVFFFLQLSKKYSLVRMSFPVILLK